MKSFKSFAAITLLALTVASCDKVKNPNELSGPTAVGTTFVTKSNAARSGYKKVLLEDYTGQKCGNCPPAAALTETLSTKYGDSLIVLAVHAGGFAVPGIAPYNNDYRTSAGDAWAGTTGFDVSTFPNGMVNRNGYPSSHLMVHTSWDNSSTGISPNLHSPMTVKLDVTTNYDSVARALNVDVKLKYKAAFPAGEVKLSVVLSEDNIAGTQKDYSLTPSDQNYVFMHMMRGSLNGDWGDLVNSSSAVALNDSTTKSYQNFAVNSALNDKRLSVIVFAYKASNKEVIQVEKVKIR